MVDAEINETIGARIRAARKAAKLKITDAAEAIGISRVTLSQWENGAVKSPDTEKLFEFTKITDCSLDWLLQGGTREPTQEKPMMQRNVPHLVEVPEISPLLTAHAARLDKTERSTWFMPLAVAELSFNATSEELFMMRINQSSGELSRGDYALIDASVRTMADDGLYIIGKPDAGVATFDRQHEHVNSIDPNVLGRVIGIFKPV